MLSLAGGLFCTYKFGDDTVERASFVMEGFAGQTIAQLTFQDKELRLCTTNEY